MAAVIYMLYFKKFKEKMDKYKLPTSSCKAESKNNVIFMYLFFWVKLFIFFERNTITPDRSVDQSTDW